MKETVKMLSLLAHTINPFSKPPPVVLIQVMCPIYRSIKVEHIKASNYFAMGNSNKKNAS